MSDVLADLKALHSNWESGSALVDFALLERAIHEIERLRKNVVPVDLASFREIKQGIKNGAVA